MTTSLKVFATRESAITGIQYTGSDASAREIKQWAGGDVELDAKGRILFQSDGHTEELHKGDYLVCVNGAMFGFTAAQLKHDYLQCYDN